MNVSSGDDLSSKIVFCVLNFVSVLVCVLAAILVFGLKLYRKIVYRLSLYQVLAALGFSTVETLQIVFVNYDQLSEVYRRLCTAIGLLEVYAEWVKLLFTAWVTFHLFCFVVLHKSLKKLEVLYVVTSLIIPAVIAAVPLITQSYRTEPLGCYISDGNGTDSAADVELFVLWNVPALIVLFAASIAMAVVVIKLGSKVHHRIKKIKEPITRGDQYWKALKQLLPLAAFPVLFFIFEVPVLVFDIYIAEGFVGNEGVTLTASVFIALWSMASGMTLIVHIFVARLYCSSRIHLRWYTDIQGIRGNYSSCDHTTEKAVVSLNSDSNTHFSLPACSLDGIDVA